MKRGHAVSFLAGVLFAVGLGVAGMTRPSKVLGFLDVAGRWDPSLACVMGAALLVGLALFPRILRRRAPVLDARFHLPEPTTIDGRLVAGSVLFGLGWGLSGVCPGPCLVALATGAPGVVAFVAAMAAGMALFEAVEARRVHTPLQAPLTAPPAPPRSAP